MVSTNIFCYFYTFLSIPLLLFFVFFVFYRFIVCKSYSISGFAYYLTISHFATQPLFVFSENLKYLYHKVLTPRCSKHLQNTNITIITINRPQVKYKMISPSLSFIFRHIDNGLSLTFHLSPTNSMA